MKGGSYELMFSLKTITFYCKKIYHLLYNPICGLLCLLSYWKSQKQSTEVFCKKRS